MPSRPPIALCFLIFNKVFGIFVNISVIIGGERSELTPRNRGEKPEFTPKNRDQHVEFTLNEQGTLGSQWDNPLLESMFLNMEYPLVLHDGSRPPNGHNGTGSHHYPGVLTTPPELTYHTLPDPESLFTAPSQPDYPPPQLSFQNPQQSAFQPSPPSSLIPPTSASPPPPPSSFSLPRVWKCSGCGNQSDITFMFCTECGHKRDL